MSDDMLWVCQAAATIPASAWFLVVLYGAGALLWIVNRLLDVGVRIGRQPYRP